jgi:hypothetical protein
MFKSKRLIWAGHVERIGEKRGTHKGIFVLESQKKGTTK